MGFGGTLPAWGLAKASVQFVWANRLDYLRVATFPCLGSAVCTALEVSIGGWWAEALLELAASAFLAVAGVKWHRYFLLGRASAQPLVVPAFHVRELRFCLYLFFITWGTLQLISASIWLIESVLAQGETWLVVLMSFLAILIVLVTAFFWGRLSLLFPAAAVEAGRGVAEHLHSSWCVMRGSTWSVVGACLLILIPLMLLLMSVYFAAADGEGTIPLAVDIGSLTVISLVESGVVVTIVSIAFDDLMLWRDGNLAARRI